MRALQMLTTAVFGREAHLCAHLCLPACLPAPCRHRQDGYAGGVRPAAGGNLQSRPPPAVRAPGKAPASLVPFAPAVQFLWCVHSRLAAAIFHSASLALLPCFLPPSPPLQNYSADLLCSSLAAAGLGPEEVLRLNDPRRPAFTVHMA